MEDNKSLLKNPWVLGGGAIAGLFGLKALFGGKNEAEESKGGGIWGWILGVGALIAGGLGLYHFGFKENAKENREAVVDGAKNVVDGAKGIVDQGKKSGSELLEKRGEIVEGVKLTAYRLRNQAGPNQDAPEYIGNYAQALNEIAETRDTQADGKVVFTRVDEVLADFDNEEFSEVLKDAAVDVSDIIDSNPTATAADLREAFLQPQ